MKSPKVLNKTLTNASTWYEVDLGDVEDFTIKCRSSNDLLYTDDPSAASVEYFTIPSGSSLSKTNIKGGVKFYLQCAAAGKVAEVIYSNV